MKRLGILIRLDFIQIVRNKILFVASLITALYILILQWLPREALSQVLPMLIFSDPVMFGFFFTGVMVLFEKAANTLPAIRVTPVRAGEYLLSKGLSLSLIALIMSLALSLSCVKPKPEQLYLFPAVIFSSLLFVFAGFIGAFRVKTFNQYFLVIPLFMIPACLPLLNYFGLTNMGLWYVIPTQASLVFFSLAFDPVSEISMLEMIYAWVYLPFSVFVAFIAARRAYLKH